MATLQRMWILFIIAMCTNHTTAAKEQLIVSAEETIRSEIFSGYSTLQRPVNNMSESVTVLLSMGFATMHDFIEKEQILSSSAYMQLRWVDHRLKWDPAVYGGVSLIPVSPSEVWLPKLMVFNAVSQEGLNVVDQGTGQILLTSDGELNLGVIVQQSTICAVRVLYFPFDKQVCTFIYGFQNWPESLGRLEVLGSYFLPFETASQWNITSITGNEETFFMPNLTSTEQVGNISIAVFSIFLERDPSYYIATLIIPSTCLCLLAFMTFLAPPDGGERLSVSVSMVVGLTVFQLLMYDLLPISNEQSLLSNFLTTNFVLVTCTVPLSLANINLAYGDRSYSLLNKRWFRLVTLEFLPKVLFVPSFSQRRSKQKISPQKSTPAGDESLAESSELGGKVTNDFSDRDCKKEERDEQMGKLEARTLAVVSDRLTFLGLFIILVVRVIWLIFDYLGQDRMPHDWY